MSWLLTSSIVVAGKGRYTLCEVKIRQETLAIKKKLGRGEERQKIVKMKIEYTIYQDNRLLMGFKNLG